MPKTTIEPATDWTCARCEVKVSWTADVERPALPATWVMEDDDLYCLLCRRERAGEAALLELGEESSAADRRQAESRGRIDFEMKRRPDAQDSRIAKSCHTSIKVVHNARARLGLQSRGPV
jgi:hypothetical protein